MMHIQLKINNQSTINYEKLHMIDILEMLLHSLYKSEDTKTILWEVKKIMIIYN